MYDNRLGYQYDNDKKQKNRTYSIRFRYLTNGRFPSVSAGKIRVGGGHGMEGQGKTGSIGFIHSSVILRYIGKFRHDIQHCTSEQHHMNNKQFPGVQSDNIVDGPTADICEMSGPLVPLSAPRTANSAPRIANSAPPRAIF